MEQGDFGRRFFFFDGFFSCGLISSAALNASSSGASILRLPWRFLDLSVTGTSSDQMRPPSEMKTLASGRFLESSG